MPISKAQAPIATFTVSLIAWAAFAQPVQAVSASLSADYASAFVTSDPSMTFGVRAEDTEHLPYGLQLSISQSILGNLVVDASKKEWEWNDTVMALLYPQPYGDHGSLSLQLSSTLPTSIESQHNELRSKTELRLSNFVDLLVPYSRFRLKVTSGASFAAYWHKYDASANRAENQNDEGLALPRYTYALDQSLAQKLMEKYTLALGGSYRVKRYHDVQEQPGLGTVKNRLEEYSYSLGLRGTYEYSDKTQFTVSYDHGSGLERPGYNDFVIFDQEQSTWTLSALQVL